MTAETTRRPVRREGFRQRMVRYWIVLATVRHMLRDRRFQAGVITRAIGAVALAQLGRDNQARPLRRAAGWYRQHGIRQELGRVVEALEPVVEALEPGKSSENSGR